MKMKAGFIGFMEQEWIPGYNSNKPQKLVIKETENGEFILFRGDVNENRARLHDLGLECLTVATNSGETLERDGVERMIERAHILEVERAVVFHGKVYFTKMNKPATYDDVMHEIEVLQKAAEGM